MKSGVCTLPLMTLWLTIFQFSASPDNVWIQSFGGGNNCCEAVRREIEGLVSKEAVCCVGGKTH